MFVRTRHNIRLWNQTQANQHMQNIYMVTSCKIECEIKEFESDMHMQMISSLQFACILRLRVHSESTIYCTVNFRIFAILYGNICT